MFGNRRYISFLALAALTLPVGASAQFPGYLATVGPSPLRFSAPVAPPTNTFLPPPAPVTVALPMPPSRPDTKPALKPTPPIVIAVPVPMSAQSTNLPALPGDEVISPQMFLKYFNKGTNGGPAVIIAPQDFTPPKAAEPLPSKATYSVTPPP